MLAIGSCKSEKRAAKLHLELFHAAAIRDFGILFSNDHGRSFHIFANINLIAIDTCRPSSSML